MNVQVAASYAEIAVFGALAKTLHYQIPMPLLDRVQTGIRVLVPLGRREAMGLVLAVAEHPPKLAQTVRFRSILAIVDDRPVVPPDLLDLCRWLSQYYFYPLGGVLQTVLPASLQTKPLTCLRIAPEGNKALASAASSEVLKYLAGVQSMTVEEIAGRLGPGRNLSSELKRLEQQGLIERFFSWPEPKLRPKRVKTIRLLSAPPAEQTAANANLRSLVHLLERAGGCLPLKVLRQEVRNPDYWIKKLFKTGLIEVEWTDELRESKSAQTLPPTPVLQPTADQEKVLAAISPSLAQHAFRPFLICGVTGSGKTEIYLRLVEETLQQERSAIVLVPEIALSTQMEALFRHRFGSQLAVWHSGLPPGARYDQWREVLAGKRHVVLGVRSAIFMPAENLGLIIVDEEHDAAYKQEDRLRYHARNVALMRGQMLRIPIVLGSATPSLQAVQYAAAGRYQLLSLPSRIHDRPLPALEVVDMRRESGPARILSHALQKALVETLENGQQALLFLNRRGFATFLMCHRCGHVIQCSFCSVSLTYHQHDQRLRCHYCGWETAPPQECPACRRGSLIYHGFGTEKVAEEIKKLLPRAGIVRIDRDTVSRAGALVTHLNAIRRHQADILVGTQMIAKGHDFPDITLVGIINADTALQIADFRAGETTVQLLMQVSGRAGRGDQPGRVILQTYNPQHYTIQSVLNRDYLNFCSKELESRTQLQYPPFTRLVKLLVTSPDEVQTRQASLQLAALCRNLAALLRRRNQPLAILGPSPAPLLKINQRYRWHIFAKAWSNQVLQDFIGMVLDRSKSLGIPARVQIAIDRDPTSSL